MDEQVGGQAGGPCKMLDRGGTHGLKAGGTEKDQMAPARVRVGIWRARRVAQLCFRVVLQASTCQVTQNRPSWIRGTLDANCHRGVGQPCVVPGPSLVSSTSRRELDQDGGQDGRVVLVSTARLPGAQPRHPRGARTSIHRGPCSWPCLQMASGLPVHVLPANRAKSGRPHLLL